MEHPVCYLSEVGKPLLAQFVSCVRTNFRLCDFSPQLSSIFSLKSR